MLTDLVPDLVAKILEVVGFLIGFISVICYWISFKLKDRASYFTRELIIYNQSKDLANLLLLLSSVLIVSFIRF